MAGADDQGRRFARALPCGAGASLFAAAAALVLACGAGRPLPARTATHLAPAAPNRSSAVAPAAQPAFTSPSAPAGPPPGSLPQTHAYPSSASAHFSSAMASLWAGVLGDSPRRALSALFPKDAYVKLKAIAAAGSDWSARLFHEYALDLAAAHALLGPGAPRARLVRVEISDRYAHWVEPGACYNATGYYEVPNARVVYRDGGALHSFGIASMISWRGEWYVVHLGALLREGDAGVVDEPAAGRGSSAYSSTC